MKKKIVFIFSALVLCTQTFCLKNSFSCGAAFTSFFLRTKVKKDQSKMDLLYKKIIQDSSDGFYSESTYGGGFFLDLNTDFLYFNALFAFPSKHQNSFLNLNSKPDKNISVIFDSQLGICYKFFENTAYPIFLGGGLGFLTSHTKLKGHLPVIGSVSFIKTDMMMGLGGTAAFSYYFTKNFGLNFSLTDTIYFMNIRTLRLLSVGGKEIKFEEKEKRKSFNAINTLGNIFGLKMGISLRF